MTSPEIDKLSRKKSIVAKAEETKVNFFSQGDLYNEDEQGEDHKIIENKVDPLEWNKEIDRVYSQLVKIEQEVEILKKQGSSESSDFEECQRHLECIIEMCHDIKQSSHFDVRKVFARSVETLDDEMALIRKHEIRINKQNSKKIQDLGQITVNKKKLATELR